MATDGATSLSVTSGITMFLYLLQAILGIVAVQDLFDIFDLDQGAMVGKKLVEPILLLFFMVIIYCISSLFSGLLCCRNVHGEENSIYPSSWVLLVVDIANGNNIRFVR